MQYLDTLLHNKKIECDTKLNYTATPKFAEKHLKLAAKTIVLTLKHLLLL